jgi:hypothetical protein
VDWSKVEAKIKDGSIDQNLGTNRALAEAMSISGTPAFIIGDQILRGAPRIWPASRPSSRMSAPARAFSNPRVVHEKTPRHAGAFCYSGCKPSGLMGRREKLSARRMRFPSSA